MMNPNQLCSIRLLCKSNELKSQICISARPDNPQTEQNFRAACSLNQNENNTSDPIISQTYQELVKSYHQITSLYLIGEIDGKVNLFTYNTENESEEAKLIETPNGLDTSDASIVQLPNGKLFCACNQFPNSSITFIINKNYELQMLPSENYFRYFTAIYFRENVYCFGKNEDYEALTYRFDLYRNLWFRLAPMPHNSYDCNSAIFNEKILISAPSSKNLFQYSIEIDSFSIIPYEFRSYYRKILINKEERLYLIDLSINRFIYETVGDEYNWKQIAKSDINLDCGQVYWIFNKRGIYISTLNTNCIREYYKFDLDQNTSTAIAYYNKHVAIRGSAWNLEAIECYNQTFNLNPEIALSYNSGKFTINYLGRKLEKIECCNEFIKLNPGDSNAYINKGDALKDLERYLEAIECYNEAIKIDHRNFDAYLNKWISLNALKMYAEAIDCSNKCINIDPYNSLGYYNKADALDCLQRYDEAIECCNEYIMINPRDAYIYEKKGDELYKLNKHLEAIECYNKSIKFRPRENNAYKKKGLALHSLKRYLEAIECYNKTLKIDPSDANAYTGKGNAFHALERYIEAIECYDEIIKIYPNNSIIYQYKGNSLRNLGRLLEAIDCYNQAIKIDPDNASFYKKKGKTLAWLDRNLEAIECYDKAIKIDPRHASAYQRKGNILFYNLDRKLEAIVCYNEAIKLDPDNPLNFFNRAFAFNFLGQEAEALQDFYRGYYLIKESQTSNGAKSSLSKFMSKFSNETLKNDLIGFLQKLTQLQESAISFKEEFKNLKDSKNQKWIKEIEEQEKTIKEQHSQFLMKAAVFLGQNKYTTEETQQKIYQIGREADEYLNRAIATISGLRTSMQQDE